MILVATRDPDRVSALFSILGEWLQTKIAVQHFSNRPSTEAQVVFCDTAAEAKSSLSDTTDRLVLVSGRVSPFGATGVRFSESHHLPHALRGQQLKQQVDAVLPGDCSG